MYSHYLNKLTACFAACAVVSLTIGCGDGRPTRVPVSGQVLIDGKPLTSGSIMLIPKGARPSFADLDEQGQFSLTCYKNGDGAVLGRHAVEISGSKQLDGDAVQWLAPKKYANQRTSGLEVNIDGPTDNLKIELTWAGGRPFIEK